MKDPTDKPVFMTVTEETPQAPEPQTASPVQPVTTPTEPPPPPQVTSGVSSGNRPLGKVVAGMMVVMLLAATGIGVFLAGRQQVTTTSAWDCSSYNFAVSREGVVTVTNGGGRNEPPQKANVKVNGNSVATFDVNALSKGQSATLGNVSVPQSGGFSWEVIGTVDCRDGGSYQQETAVSCSKVTAYDKNWQPLAATALANLKIGDIVRFSAVGAATSGTIDKARFTINGVERSEVTLKRPGTNEFYDEYTIPAGVTSFNVTAKVHHIETDQWYQ